MEGTRWQRYSKRNYDNQSRMYSEFWKPSEREWDVIIEVVHSQHLGLLSSMFVVKLWEEKREKTRQLVQEDN